MKFERYDSYKDSGIEWLGEVPSEWKIMRIKDVFHHISEKSSNIEMHNYVPLENIESITGKLIKRFSNDNNEEALLFKVQDILFNKLRPYLAKAFVANFNGGVSSEAMVLRIKKLMTDKHYSKFYFKS